MRTEYLVVFVLIGSSACSLLAPSDGDLSGEWGTSGAYGLGDGGQANSGGRTSGNGKGGSEPTLNGGRASGGDTDGEGGVDVSQGGAAPLAGAGNDGEGGTPGSARGGAKSSGGTSAAGSQGLGGTSPIAGSGGKTGAGGVAVVGVGGKVAAGGSSGGNVASANGGSVAAAGGKVGAGGAGSGGTITGAGGAVSHCSPNPCVRGTCSEAGSSYKCTCPAGWGGATCAVGSCATLSCPSSAPCTVPTSSVAAVCYPSACVGSSGLCMAENADGSGDAIIIQGRNSDFDPLSGSNWRNRAKYFAYLDDAHGRYACVFPQQSEGGTPLVIPLNTVRTKTTGFGQSNSWPNPPTCEYP